MGPQQSFSPPPTSFISVSFTRGMRSLHWDVAQRQTRSRCCGENLASPKTLRRDVSFIIGVLNLEGRRPPWSLFQKSLVS